MAFGRRKMGYEGVGRQRRGDAVVIERGGIKFRLDGQAGTVTCPMCRVYGSASGADMTLFMAQHVELHTGRAAAPGAPDRGVVIAGLVELLAQLGADELAVIVELATRLAAGRAQYGELQLATDARDFAAEAADELRDYLIYRAIDSLRRRRQAGGP
jgi:hypothetical protein